jgi:hypothetical protein
MAHFSSSTFIEDLRSACEEEMFAVKELSNNYFRLVYPAVA